jgi:hypothetical protein
MFRRRVVLVYLGVSLGGAVLLGWGYQLFS